MIYPDRLVDEVTPGLWIGGSWEAYDPSDSWDVTFTVCHPIEAGPPPPGSHLQLALMDIARVDEPGVAAVVDAVVAARRKRLRTLVRCHMGLNRSALVVALALMRLEDLSGADVVPLLRSRRSPRVLCNRTFEAYVLGEPARLC